MPTRWEYRIVEGASANPDNLTAQLNGLGAEGWEAVASWGIKKSLTADAAAILLKRPLN